uniref:E3 SUMO-protein ligase NSE2 n=1 Tax=Panagrolaimus sp. ES5 TaxID=591445 RepID=A0AC34G9N9_9BILA
MYQPSGYYQTFALQQIHDLLTAMQTGLAKQPVTNEENKKAMIDSLKEIDKMAKEFAINEKVESQIAIKMQEDIAEARQTRNMEKLMTPTQESFQAIHAQVSANVNELQTYRILKETIKKVTKAIKDGKEKAAENNGDDEEEEEIISEAAVVRMKDPITKERITEPVRNAHCGHVYNKPSIIAYIKDNHQRNYLCQCPQPGCSNKRKLIQEDIEDYPEFFETAVLER